MKQKFTLASAIMMVIELILFFTPYCFIVNHWQYESSLVYHGIKALKHKENVDIFALNNTVSRIFAISAIIIVILTLVLYIMKLLGKKNPLSKFTYYIPIALLGVYFIYFLYSAFLAEYDTAKWYNNCSPNWGAYVILGMNIVLAILGVLSKRDRFSIKNNQEEMSIASPASEISGELKAYKQLLDDGIIAQEDYDAKKKQTLGL